MSVRSSNAFLYSTYSLGSRLSSYDASFDLRTSLDACNSTFHILKADFFLFCQEIWNWEDIFWKNFSYISENQTRSSDDQTSAVHPDWHRRASDWSSEELNKDYLADERHEQNHPENWVVACISEWIQLASF